MTQTDSSTLTLKTKSSSSVATFIHLSTTGKPLRNSTRPPTKLKTIATVVYCSSMPATHNGASTARCWVVTPKNVWSLSRVQLLRLLYNFFDWSLNQKVGKDGRKRRGTRKSSSLSTYWKVFRLVFERATGDKLDPKLNRRMHKVLRDLSKKHDLSDQRRANRCMTIEDLKEQIETTISTTKKSFRLGELRILAVLFLLLLAPAGARPTSILRLRFGDIRLALVKDPEGGPHNILIRFTLAFTKTYLGVKDAKTFPLPETLADPSLLLNPHIFLLGILFRHRAFRATSLNSPAQLANLDIHPEERSYLCRSRTI
ncbi:uncharacterized protein HRG_11333 [Hirsutella rhossiliensis]|uniref:Uncharacterized protein n=1 Tax=Hirsutella rhossiliensis TaxID=111463 RepID=A0A9P8MP17_9HYPO|nr:uncharacterized protein HRG_11333 [Hirsutella rhossiliensis]KAH0957551.1 hypothetical protein HRG_11333 [Hirsutella rhossiliensis]